MGLLSFNVRFSVVSALFVQLLCCGFALGKLEVLYKWKYIDYDFPNNATRHRMIERGEYIPQNQVPIDVDYHEEGGTFFVTIPKFRRGIPASLSTISKTNGSVLKPYPDWSWHKGDTCNNGITSVFRTQIDKCARLWAIDSGVVDIAETTSRRACQPQLLAFTLNNNKLLKRHKISDNVLSGTSLLGTVAVDITGTTNRCQDTHVYIADISGFAIVVYDYKKDRSWRVQANSMFPYPPYGHFKMNGVEFDLMDGVIGLALGPLKKGDRLLYYHPLASVVESWVPTSIIRNESLFSNGFNSASSSFKTSKEVRPSQTPVEAIDKHGIIYFVLVSTNELACWNTETEFDKKNIHTLLKDETNLQFASGIKVHLSDQGDENLFLMTNRFQLSYAGGYKSNEDNFRVIKIDLKKLRNPCKTHVTPTGRAWSFLKALTEG